MGRQLRATVYLHDEEGVVRGFGPGDTVPDWVAAQITNPDAWVDDETAPAADPAGDESAPHDNTEGAPPKTGKGSGLANWLAYAESLGVEVPEDAGRDDVIAAVEAAS